MQNLLPVCSFYHELPYEIWVIGVLLTHLILKIAVIWNVTQCSLVEGYCCFRWTCRVALLWWWRKQFPLKTWHISTTLCSITFTAVKNSYIRILLCFGHLQCEAAAW